MTFEFVSPAQCLSKMVGNVATGSYCSLQTLTNFPSSSVPMVFVSGVLGGVSRFADVLLRSLVSQVIKILFEGWCDGVIVMGLLSSQIPCIKGLDKPCNFKTLHPQF